MEGGGGGGRGSPRCMAILTPLAARTVLMKSSCFARQLLFGALTSCNDTFTQIRTYASTPFKRQQHAKKHILHKNPYFLAALEFSNAHGFPISLEASSLRHNILNLHRLSILMAIFVRPLKYN